MHVHDTDRVYVFVGWERTATSLAFHVFPPSKVSSSVCRLPRRKPVDGSKQTRRLCDPDIAMV